MPLGNEAGVASLSAHRVLIGVQSVLALTLIWLYSYRQNLAQQVQAGVKEWECPICLARLYYLADRPPSCNHGA